METAHAESFTMPECRHLLRKLFSQRNMRLVDRYAAAIAWLRKNSVSTGGVRVASAIDLPYPEVSGYLIPSLVSWGERELALSYAGWLLTVQNRDGSWSDPSGSAPYTFDTGQILKGLFTLLPCCPEYEEAIRAGCDWLLSRVETNGRITTPDTSQWVLPGNRRVPEAIHLYVLEPLKIAAELWGVGKYSNVVERALDYYTKDPVLCDFTTLAHFHAYILEALVDLGRPELAAAGMQTIESLQKRNGFIPAYRDSGWCCSTALFQYALVWYKLGKTEHGDRTFSYACRLQNKSGGFYGGYGLGATYFPKQEISWAVKYFLDAFWWRIRSGFDAEVGLFPSSISDQDGRYRLIVETARTVTPRTTLEAGCGKGRFLRLLSRDLPTTQLTGLDIADEMLASLPANIVPLNGSLLNIPAPDGSFDLVFSVEALEHAVNIRGAIRELCRVVAPGGTLVIIDKNVDKLGHLRIAPWEQWFDAEEVAAQIGMQGFTVTIRRNIPYDTSNGTDGLFLGWIARKRS